jgi:hypothetical protein
MLDDPMYDLGAVGLVSSKSFKEHQEGDLHHQGFVSTLLRLVVSK